MPPVTPMVFTKPAMREATHAPERHATSQAAGRTTSRLRQELE
jgi:hypothetical protein